MLEFERERASLALQLEPTQRDAFRQGRDGKSLYFPTDEESVLAFQLGLDFRFKRLGVDDKVSAKDIFAQGEFFTNGFLTRLSMLPLDSTGRIQSQDFVVAHINSLRQRHLFDANDWSSYIRGAISALDALLINNAGKMSRLIPKIVDSDSELGEFIKINNYQKSLTQESEALKDLLGETFETSTTQAQSTNTMVLQKQTGQLENVPNIEPPVPNIKPTPYK